MSLRPTPKPRNVRTRPATLNSAKLRSASKLNYVGFVEGDDIFSGEVDVVVTDGFTGNVALKTMEGLANMLVGALKTTSGAGAAGS